MSGQPSQIESIAVIGAGIIGLSCALELADRGVRVSLYDKTWPPRGASWAAAGMLAPTFEAAPSAGTHPNLFDLCDQSAQMWPLWSMALELRTGCAAGYVPGPSLAIACDSAQAETLAQVAASLAEHGSAPQDCSAEVHTLEPGVCSDVMAAYLLPSDGQADSRQTLAALVAAVEAHEAITLYTEEAPLKSTGSGLDHAGHDATLVCAGWGTAIVKAEENGERLSLLNWETLLDEIDCYGGQMLAVEPVEGAPQMIVRCGHLYIVPKSDRIIIGATTEPGRVLEAADPDVIARLKAEAATLCPALAIAPVIESWAGVRPGTADDAPILGETRTPGLFVASGHFRNGILLAPITAQIMADLIVTGKTSALAESFSPRARLAAEV
ncbi:MAG: FAD-dependent oxidoreductase [Pseudomonadota bacterium]